MWECLPHPYLLCNIAKDTYLMPRTYAHKPKYVESMKIKPYLLLISRWTVLWESSTPRESTVWGFCRQHLATLATPTIRSIKCKQSPVYRVFDRYFHIPLPIVTKHELGLPFPPRNLPIKFGTNPSTIFVVIMVTDRQTHKPTPVKTYSLAFEGRIILRFNSHFSRWTWVSQVS